jgi:hypothetical protein
MLPVPRELEAPLVYLLEAGIGCKWTGQSLEWWIIAARVGLLAARDTLSPLGNLFSTSVILAAHSMSPTIVGAEPLTTGHVPVLDYMYTALALAECLVHALLSRMAMSSDGVTNASTSSSLNIWAAWTYDLLNMATMLGRVTQANATSVSGFICEAISTRVTRIVAVMVGMARTLVRAKASGLYVSSKLTSGLLNAALDLLTDASNMRTWVRKQQPSLVAQVNRVIGQRERLLASVLVLVSKLPLRTGDRIVLAMAVKHMHTTSEVLVALIDNVLLPGMRASAGALAELAGGPKTALVAQEADTIIMMCAVLFVMPKVMQWIDRFPDGQRSLGQLRASFNKIMTVVYGHPGRFTKLQHKDRLDLHSICPCSAGVEPLRQLLVNWRKLSQKEVVIKLMVEASTAVLSCVQVTERPGPLEDAVGVGSDMSTSRALVSLVPSEPNVACRMLLRALGCNNLLCSRWRGRRSAAEALVPGPCTFKVCSCLRARYCSKACQRMDWKLHGASAGHV